MSLQDIVSVAITRASRFPSRAGFGTPMIAAVVPWVQLARSFASVAEAESAGATSTAYPALHGALSKLFGQNPAPERVVVAKRTNYTETWTLEVLTTTVGYVYTFSVWVAGVENVITYTVQSGDDASEIATALAALIDPLSDLTAAAVGAVITVTATAGKFVGFTDLPYLTDLEIKDTTADPGIAADLSAFEKDAKKRSLEWYAFTLDRMGEAEINAARVWARTRITIFVPEISDSICADSGTTTDVMSDIKAAAEDRTMVPIFSGKSTQDFKAAALLGSVLTFQPGKITWTFRTLTGCVPDAFDSAERDAILAKYGTVYETVNAVNITFECKVGSNEYPDAVVNTDFLKARIAEDCFGVLVTNPIVPFDSNGIALMRQTVQDRLDASTQDPNPILSNDEGFEPFVTSPSIANIDPADKNSRTLRDLKWTAKFKGAIHKAAVTGTITP